MNHIIEITPEQLEEFASLYGGKIKRTGVEAYTVEDACTLLKEAVNTFKDIFPQRETYKACLYVYFKYQCFMDDISQIQDALSEISELDVVLTDVRSFSEDFDNDEPYIIQLFVGNITNYDEQLMAELLKRARNNDEDAVYQLGCNPEDYGDCVSLCPNNKSEFNTELFIFNRFINSAGSVPELMALAAAFFHGLVVEKDEHMADILTDCANNAMERYTDEERQERECWFDPDAVQYYFLGNTPADREYVLNWIERQSQSDTIFHSQAQMLMEYYDRKSIVGE